MSWIEWLAVLAGLLCVWFTIRENIWCWPLGLVQVSLYVWIFYNAKLYSDFLLHIVYIFLQFYGWYSWLYGGKGHTELSIRRMSISGFLITLVLTLLATFLWGAGMERYTDASLPYWDAFTTMASLTAQWLLTRKKLDSWIFWISVDIVAIGVYFYKGLLPTAGLYAVFLFLASAGFWKWSRIRLNNKIEVSE
ncbi:MAG TPA: aminotransferase [Leptospiraceae bacterium]|nr:aminotransferase [Spirochaetaceae bacterium]HBS06084.1 aminotransferase [Leptospiraceae bacterium]